MKKDLVSYYNDLEDSKKSPKKIWLVISILSFVLSILFLSGITGNVIGIEKNVSYFGLVFILVGIFSIVIYQKEGWQIRKVSYAYIHNVDEKDMNKLVESLELKNNLIIGDFMCGYGDVTKHILDYSKKNNIINLIIFSSDLYKKQLDRINEYVTPDVIANARVMKRISDIRNLKFPANKFDRVVIKMGLHEILHKEQLGAAKQIYRVLKKDGIFSTWDVMPNTKEGQLLFQKIIRKKDELAGFGNFAKRRYFFREDEIKKTLKEAGFRDIKFYHEIKYRLETHKRLEQEFNNDKNKLIEWNDYVRKIVPESMKKAIDYKDNGDSIAMTFRKGIITAKR